MNWDTISGKWKEMKGEVRKKWADMTDSDFEAIGGNKDKMVGWLQKKYGYAKDRAEREVGDWDSRIDESDADLNRQRDL